MTHFCPFAALLCKQLPRKWLEEFIKENKTDTRAQAFFVEDYVREHSVTFQDTQCCVLKGKYLSIDVKVREVTKEMGPKHFPRLTEEHFPGNFTQ